MSLHFAEIKSPSTRRYGLVYSMFLADSMKYVKNKNILRKPSWVYYNHVMFYTSP